VLAAVVGGLVLFIGGTVTLALVVASAEARPNRQTLPVAQNTGTTPTPAPTPTPTPRPGPSSTPAPHPNPVPVEPITTPNPHPMPPPAPRLPPELQQKVDTAIEKGLAFLRSQEKNGAIGNWSGYEVGPGFLAGLTLLECGVPADEPILAKQITRARDYARGTQGLKTYEATLALLLLDRLGDAADKPLIQSLALRLLAGQLQGGGWSYDCPGLSPETQKAFLYALERSRPEKAGDLVLRDKAGLLIDSSGRALKEENLDPKAIKGIESGYNKLMSVQEDLKSFPELQRVPSLRPDDGNGAPEPPKPMGKIKVRVPRAGGGNSGDNSNTQFAALGLWVASRHDVPCERALALLAGRFRTSQGNAGGWGYFPGQGEQPATTCAGLLALAIGHGLDAEEGAQKRADHQINTALKYLGTQLSKNPEALSRNLYFMWSLERVGVLFNLEKVGEHDWYQWGAKHLVKTQTGEGAWGLGGYHGSVPLHDTCFALLFLKKANLVRDLSDKLDKVLDIKGTSRQGGTP
jgi:hypothetical protein